MNALDKSCVLSKINANKNIDINKACLVSKNTKIY